jgi:aldose 1-epimerase
MTSPAPLDSTPLDSTRFAGQVNDQPTALYTLRNGRGMSVAVTNLGAKVLQILVPDRHGQPGDVALGYDNLASVLAGSPSMGAFIGRFAGRIAQARFTLNGIEHTLPANAGQHCVHGGPGGSRHQVFRAEQTDERTLHLHHRFTPQNDGFPGTLDLHLTYRLEDDNTLVIEHEAVAVEGTCVASFAPHGYFNLEGPGHTTIDQHLLSVHADALLLADADNVITGEQVSLTDHPLDLRTPRRLGSEAGDGPRVIDHAYVVSGNPDGERLCAMVSAARSGRTLEVWSTEPVLQVYTADALGRGHQPDLGKNGVPHRPRAGLCLEPQQYPNAPNCPGFPQNTVEPGRPYTGRTRYSFGLMA